MFTVATRLNLLLIVVVICFALYIYTINIEINKIDRHVHALEKLVKELISQNQNVCQNQYQSQVVNQNQEEPIFVVAAQEDDHASICSNDIQNILSSITCLEGVKPIIIVEEEEDFVSQVFKMSDEQLESLKNEKLRDFLSACNEDTKGNKKTLVDRVKKVVRGKEQNIPVQEQIQTSEQAIEQIQELPPAPTPTPVSEPDN